VATVGRTVERWAREEATGRKPYSEGLRRRVAAIELGTQSFNARVCKILFERILYTITSRSFVRRVASSRVASSPSAQDAARDDEKIG